MNKERLKNRRERIKFIKFLNDSIKIDSEYKEGKRRIVYKYLSASSAYKVLKGVDDKVLKGVDDKDDKGIVNMISL
ncbi:MAG: hypothetical protein IKS92_01695, partial [Victivallales bacterium]|nr:hypothetical protein [Victivallales bacterium]